MGQYLDKTGTEFLVNKIKNMSTGGGNLSNYPLASWYGSEDALMLLEYDLNSGKLNNPSYCSLDHLYSGTDAKDEGWNNVMLDNRDWFSFSDHAMVLNWDYIEENYGLTDGVLMGWDIALAVNSEVHNPTVQNYYAVCQAWVLDSEDQNSWFGYVPNTILNLNTGFSINDKYSPVWNCSGSFICYVPKNHKPLWRTTIRLYGDNLDLSNGDALGIDGWNGAFNIYSSSRVQAYLIV